MGSKKFSVPRHSAIMAHLTLVFLPPEPANKHCLFLGSCSICSNHKLHKFQGTWTNRMSSQVHVPSETNPLLLHILVCCDIVECCLDILMPYKNYVSHLSKNICLKPLLGKDHVGFPDTEYLLQEFNSYSSGTWEGPRLYA